VTRSGAAPPLLPSLAAAPVSSTMTPRASSPSSTKLCSVRRLSMKARLIPLRAVASSLQMICSLLLLRMAPPPSWRRPGLGPSLRPPHCSSGSGRAGVDPGFYMIGPFGSTRAASPASTLPPLRLHSLKLAISQGPPSFSLKACTAQLFPSALVLAYLGRYCPCNWICNLWNLISATATSFSLFLSLSC
jgi:hypothetical protein